MIKEKLQKENTLRLMPKKEDFDNVIIFPTEKRRKINTTPPKVAEKVRQHQTRLFVEDLIDTVAIPMVKSFADSAVDCKKDTFIKDLSFIIESIKSLLYRDFELKHPMQNVVDNTTRLSMNGRKPMTIINYDKFNHLKTPKVKTQPVSDIISDEVRDLADGVMEFNADFDISDYDN